MSAAVTPINDGGFPHRRGLRGAARRRRRRRARV